MTLDEIFKKYSDEQKVYRAGTKYISPKTVGWCKQLKAWGNQESREMGFWIPDYMIKDANADDWELAVIE